MAEMKDLLRNAILAAIAGGKEILMVYDTKFEVEYKDDHSPLTEADKRANNKIIEMLNHFNIPFLTEETVETEYETRKNWQRLWIVDPLDGTKEFVKRNGEFTVNIALVENQKPILGVIYSPVFKDLYFAAKDFGSFKTDRHHIIEALNQTEISVDHIIEKAKKLPTENERSKYMVVASRSHLSPETHQHIEQLKKEHGEVELINTGSSIKICLVAEGKADEYPRYGPTMEWDTAAGHAIAEFAGKKIIDLETNQSIIYNRKNIRNNSFIVK